MASGQCFRNAFLHASKGDAHYCEGFAAGPGGDPFHHAWIAGPDGQAIDVTLDDPKAYAFLGIEFARTAFVELTRTSSNPERQDVGKWGFMRPPFVPGMLERLIGPLSEIDRELGADDDQRPGGP
jgi:hypothetical protein